jgi:hypothetical protein
MDSLCRVHPSPLSWLLYKSYTIWRIFMPRHIMAWAYSVTLFRPSVIQSSSVSLHYLSNGCSHSTQILHMDKSWENTSQVWIWIMVRWFLAELCPFYYQKYMKFSVCIHYLSNGITHSTQTWHMDMSWENTGQVRIWSTWNMNIFHKAISRHQNWKCGTFSF